MEKRVLYKSLFYRRYGSWTNKKINKYALDNNLEKEIFVLEANSEKTFEVCFIGDHDWNNVKQIRLLPRFINIELIK